MRLHTGSLESLDQRVRHRLADSLEHLFARMGSPSGADSTAERSLLRRIREQAQHPRVFARYYELVLALKSARHDVAAHIRQGLRTLPEDSRQSGIFAFTEEELGEDFSRFSRLLFAEDGLDRPLAAPEAVSFEATRQLLVRAQAALRDVDAEAAAEVGQLWPQIYLARPDQVGRIRFAGVTSFMTWGAGVMNVEAFSDPFAVATFLVHETTHSLLFALGCDEPLVLNPLSESYPSPLRRDPRPMDGIFHATVVCARTLDFHRRCLEHDGLDASRRQHLDQQIRRDADFYASGRSVIQAHGQLSGRAHQLLDACDRIVATVLA